MRRLQSALTVQVIEDSGDDVGIFNARNESDCTPALLADFNIDAEYPFEAACPGHRADNRHKKLLGVMPRLTANDCRFN